MSSSAAWSLLLAACAEPPPPAPVAVVEEAPPAPPAESPEPPPQNHPPKVLFFGVTPEKPTAGDRLVATITHEDEDHDPVRVGYSWKVNGVELASVAGPEFPPGRAVHGDKVELLVTLDDGVQPMKASFGPVTIANRPPVLAPDSIHPTRLDSFTPRATDPDGDPIKWSLSGGAPGLTMDTYGTLHHALPPDAAAGDYEVKVVADDGFGGTAELRIPVKVTAGRNR